MMSISIREKHVSYDNPCAPIVRFSSNTVFTNKIDDDDEDMTDDSLTCTNTNESTLNPALSKFIDEQQRRTRTNHTYLFLSFLRHFTCTGEHSFKALSLEDLVKSFDTTINACFPEQQSMIEPDDDPSIDEVTSSK
jgi:hypothetical protein